jgi:hypothetical protein
MTLPALIFLDVDGTLLPYGPGAALAEPGSLDGDRNPLLTGLNLDHGPRLLALRCELVWATGWMDEANDELCPPLGLPRLPVVDWPDECDDGPGDRLHWKTRAIVAWAAGRPFVWIDDEFTQIDRDWVTVNHPGQALLVRVEPHLGITEVEFTAIESWLADL